MEHNLPNRATQPNQPNLVEEIVTGEAVALELPAATALTRIASGVLDYVLYLIILLCCFATFLQLDNFSSETSTRIMTIIFTATWLWIMPAIITIFTRGSSVGKFLTRTRIVRLDGGPINAHHAFIRSTLGIFEVFISLGIFALAAVFFSKKAQRLGDMYAGTYVVRWPRGKITEPVFNISPALQQWAQTAQIKEIPPGLQLNIVNHFKSAKKLSPTAHMQQATILAASLESYCHPAPPWNTPADDFLQAVCAIRYQIETNRQQQLTQQQQQLINATQTLPY